MRKSVELLKYLYDNRLREDGWVETSELYRFQKAKYEKSYFATIRQSLFRFSYSGGCVQFREPPKKRGHGNSYKWRITKSGIKYLQYMGVITPEEAQRAIEEIKRRDMLMGVSG